MSTIEPGTPVRVIITGEFLGGYGDRQSFVTPLGQTFFLRAGDPAMQVIPAGPERPTLDRDALVQAISQAAGGYNKATRPIQDAADAVLDLIEAAHPGLIR